MSPKEFVFLVARPVNLSENSGKVEDFFQRLEANLISSIPRGLRAKTQEILDKIHESIREDMAMLSTKFIFAHWGIMIDNHYYHLKKDIKGHIALDTTPFPPDSIIIGFPIWKTKLSHEERGGLACQILARMSDMKDPTSISVYGEAPLHSFHYDGFKSGLFTPIRPGMYHDVFNNCHDFVYGFLRHIMVPTTTKESLSSPKIAAEMIALLACGKFKKEIRRGSLVQRYKAGIISEDQLIEYLQQMPKTS